MIMTTKMKTEAAAMIAAMIIKRNMTCTVKSYYQKSRFSPM